KDALVSFGPDRLKNKKIRDGGSIVHIHEGRNRPVGVVRSHADVVSFGKSSNSLHSRDTTRVDKIALEDIDSLVLEERSNAVDRSPPLSCGNGNCRRTMDDLKNLQVLGRNRFFDEEKIQVFQGLTQSDSGLQSQPAVTVQRQRKFWAACFASSDEKL